MGGGGALWPAPPRLYRVRVDSVFIPASLNSRPETVASVSAKPDALSHAAHWHPIAAVQWAF
jgi:hypothetical protein